MIKRCEKRHLHLSIKRTTLLATMFQGLHYTCISKRMLVLSILIFLSLYQWKCYHVFFSIINNAFVHLFLTNPINYVKKELYNYSPVHINYPNKSKKELEIVLRIVKDVIRIICYKMEMRSVPDIWGWSLVSK